MISPEIKALISLSAAVVNETDICASVMSGIDLDMLYHAAFHHQMTSLAAVALERAGVKDSRFVQERAKAIRKSLIFESEREAVVSALTQAQIWHAPIKGILLQNCYPQIGLRQMADQDILFDAERALDVKMIMESLGFQTIHFGVGHQDTYQKPPVSNFEMHRTLFTPDTNEKFYLYYRDIADKLISKGQFERCFSNEDFYLYMVAHTYKHFRWRGTGLRSLLDIYVYLKQYSRKLNWDYIRTELRKLEIQSFEEEIRLISLKLFTPGTDLASLSEEQMARLALFANSGAYGTVEQGFRNAIEKQGRMKYVIHRIILPMHIIKKEFPFFYKHKILLPALPFYRLIRGWKKAKIEMKAVTQISSTSK